MLENKYLEIYKFKGLEFMSAPYLKQQRESFRKSLKIMHVIESRSNFDRLKQRHSEHGENEHYEKE